MAATPQGFRWGSALGISVTLFLIYSFLNVTAAILVPLTLHLGGVGAATWGFILGAEADAAMLGRSLQDIGRTDPRLGYYLVAFMTTMCMMMMAFGILGVAVTWFALRRALAWAFWALVVANVSYLPYFLAIASTVSGFGVPLNLGGLFFYVIFPLPLLLAIVLGWMGIQRRPAAPASLAGTT